MFRALVSLRSWDNFGGSTDCGYMNSRCRARHLRSAHSTLHLPSVCYHTPIKLLYSHLERSCVRTSTSILSRASWRRLTEDRRSNYFSEVSERGARLQTAEYRASPYGCSRKGTVLRTPEDPVDNLDPGSVRVEVSQAMKGRCLSWDYE